MRLSLRSVATMLALLSTTVISAQDDVDERAVLLEFYQATGGVSWANNNGWIENSSDYCLWHGVICEGDADVPKDIEQRRRAQSSSSAYKIIGIDLGNNDLAGRTPDSLWTLPMLKYVDVSFNRQLDLSFVNLEASSTIATIKLHDTDTQVVTGIAAAANTLTSFHISGAPLNSKLPNELFDLTNLQFLHMSDCNVQGPIPSDLSRLSELRELNIAENDLTGTLPTAMKNLIHLRVLAVSVNKLTGALPDFMNDFLLLHEVFASDNNFYGPVPAFDTQPGLYRLQLQNNAFTGSLPSDFLLETLQGDAPKVTVDVSGNHLSGRVPASLDALKGLALELNLADNDFTEVAEELCDNSNWNGGITDQYGCDGVLCPILTFSSTGRATFSEECVECLTVQVAGSTSCLQQDDKSVLKALYVATAGNGWRKNDGWLDIDDYCQWYGVTCWRTNDKVNGRVQNVELPNNGLQGSIPESIFNLEHLTVLNLSRNDIVLPFTRIWASPRIRTVNIASTRTINFDGIQDAGEFFAFLFADHLPIYGNLPVEIMKIRSLQVFSMADSGLIGELSQMIGQMESLQELYLFNNELRGPVPASFQYLYDLRILSLAKNQLRGPLPDSLEKLVNLEAVSLADQVTKGGGLTGSVLSFTIAPKLTSLMLGGNKFGGEIPLTLLNSVEVDTPVMVDLSNNMIAGTVPGSLARFKSMNIYLEGNEFSDIDDRLCQLDDWMDGLVGQYECDAILCPKDTSGGRQVFSDGSCQKCKGSTFEPTGWIGQEQCGEEDETPTERALLERFYNQCGGVGWHNSKNWNTDANFCTWYGITCDDSNSVKDIVLGANQLIGFFPTELYRLPKLEKLSVYSNSIEFYFEGIENAENLKKLILDATSVRSLEGIGKARALRELSVRYNSLKGKFPEGIASLVNLESLVVSDNSFSGEIPFWISSLPSLTTFLAANNDFSGPVYDFADMSSLEYLDLSGNKLNGKIPPTLLQSANPNKKAVVDVSSNAITGTVPAALQRFSSLSIHMSDNQITDIDEELCELGGWNDNDVRSFGCDGILCPVGYANSAGRQTSSSYPCVQCSDAHFMGSTACAGATSNAFRPTLFFFTGMASLIASALYFM